MTGINLFSRTITPPTSFFCFLFLPVVLFCQNPPIPPYEEGTIYLKTWDTSSVQINYDPNNLFPPLTGINAVFAQYGVTNVALPFTACDDIMFDHIYKISFSTGSVQNFMSALSQFNFVEYIERVPLKTITTVPNDPITSDYLQLIDAYEAFDIHTGGGATVAIVDDAVMINHEDLSDNIDSDSYDVAELDNNPSPPVFATPTVFSHGTHVAGIAGAVTDNGKGIASIGWNNSIMGIKCVEDNGIPQYITYGYEGVCWAIDHNADVINMSWGSESYSESEYYVLKEARDKRIILVAAAGNFASATPFYPAAYGEGTTNQTWEADDNRFVVSVASIDASSNRSSFTNFGQWVDVSAYGSGITSTVANSIGGSTPVINTYGVESGTSMAAPQVAGLAGLMRSYNPSKSDEEIIDCILGTANDDIYDPVSYPGNIPGTIGSGRIDAYQALLCLGTNCQFPLAVIFPSASTVCSGGSATLTANEGLAYQWSTNETTRTITITSPGTYAVTVTFNGGCTASTSIEIEPAPTSVTILATETSGNTADDGILCGSDALVNLTAIWGLSYEWSAFGATGQSIQNINAVNTSLPYSATFSVTVTGVGGCVGVTDVADIQITWYENPNAGIQIQENSGIPDDGLICNGTSATLTSNGGSSYLWSTGSTTNSISVNPGTTTTYSVTVTNQEGCSVVLEQTIVVSTCTPANDCSSCPPPGININASNNGTLYSTLGLPPAINASCIVNAKWF